MRKTYNSKIVEDKKGNFIGVSLGSDFCAEHERGIKGIESEYAIGRIGIGIVRALKGERIYGIKNRQITNSGLVKTGSFTKNKIKNYYISSDRKGWGDRKDDRNKYYKDRALQLSSQLGDGSHFGYNRDFIEVASMWDEDDFLISTTRKDIVKDLEKAFSDLDIVFFFAGGNVFENPGLHIAIASRLPKEFTDSMYETDKDNHELEKAVNKTKILDILDNAGKGYYACGGRWKDDSKTEVVFWLNPREQDENNYGWFTVEELKQWAKGEGPIPKKNKQM